jgi:hypothetical protein
MNETIIISFLVYPGKQDTNPKDSLGVNVIPNSTLYNKLCEVFDRSDYECIIPVRFKMANDGSQYNAFRAQFISFLTSPNLVKGGEIANRLRDITTKKPGLGLLFLMVSNKDSFYKLVVSRFPADQGILAVESQDSLQIEYVERIFMKNSAHYKAALYTGTSFDNDFWEGHVIDRQLNEPANYWIHEFLDSDYKTTSKFGTNRLAAALKDATQHAQTLEVKQEIVAASILAKNQFGRSTSVNAFLDQLGVSQETKELIIEQLPNSALAKDTFLLDSEEFLKVAPLASVELDTGGIMLAPSDRFDTCFRRETLNSETQETRFTATGHIVDEKLKGRR